MDLRQYVSSGHATEDAKLFCMYMFHHCLVNQTQLAYYFHKDKTTINSWIAKHERGSLIRDEAARVKRKFGPEKRQWIVDLYKVYPILYLDETQHRFQAHFQQHISKVSVSTMLREAGLTHKVIERRAIRVTMESVIIFMKELSEFTWLIESLVFLDEVSFDNREMYRKRGFGIFEGPIGLLPRRILHEAKSFALVLPWFNWNHRRLLYRRYIRSETCG
jgi:transposase